MKAAFKKMDKMYKGIDVSKLGRMTRQEICDKYGDDVVWATSRYFLKYPEDVVEE